MRPESYERVLGFDDRFHGPVSPSPKLRIQQRRENRPRQTFEQALQLDGVSDVESTSTSSGAPLYLFRATSPGRDVLEPRPEILFSRCRRLEPAGLRAPRARLHSASGLTSSASNEYERAIGVREGPRVRGGDRCSHERPILNNLGTPRARATACGRPPGFSAAAISASSATTRRSSASSATWRRSVPARRPARRIPPRRGRRDAHAPLEAQLF